MTLPAVTPSGKPPLSDEDVAVLGDIQILEIHSGPTQGMSYNTFCWAIGRNHDNARPKTKVALKQRLNKLEQQGWLMRVGANRFVTRQGEKVLIDAGKLADYTPVVIRTHIRVPYLLYEAAVGRWGEAGASDRIEAAVLDGFEERIKKALEEP
jgi:hypothetical protein